MTDCSALVRHAVTHCRREVRQQLHSRASGSGRRLSLMTRKKAAMLLQRHRQRTAAGLLQLRTMTLMGCLSEAAERVVNTRTCTNMCVVCMLG